MAEEKTESTGGGGKKKTLILVAALLLIEAGAIIGAMMLLGGPADVAATDELGNIIVPEEEMILEIPILQDKLYNRRVDLRPMRSGRSEP